MRCPNCNEYLYAENTRESDDGKEITRWRICKKCNYRVMTVETFANEKKDKRTKQARSSCPSPKDIRANDFVDHMPSGEEWVVCGVNHRRGSLVPCGYPFPTMAYIEDCKLVESRGIPQSEEQKKALRDCGLCSYIEEEESDGEINI